MKTIFVPLVACRWPQIVFTSVEHPERSVSMPLNCLVSLDGAVFYQPIYLSLELLRQDFPDAEVMELELHISTAPGKAVKYSAKTNLDGQLIAETHIELPNPDSQPPCG